MFTINLMFQSFPQENEKEYSDLKQNQDVDGEMYYFVLKNICAS